MMVAPRAQVTQKASRSSVVFGLAALSYVFSLLLSVFIGRKQGSTAISPADFTSLDGIRKGLGTKEGALAALSASKPGVGKTARDVELEAANAEVARLSEAVKELAVKLTLLEGKGGSGWR